MTDHPRPATKDTAEAAHYLHTEGGFFVSRESLQRWAKNGTLKFSFKLPNRQWRHSVAELDSIIAERKRKQAQQ
jgi:predicted site-specific integrase-resolvase